MKLYHGTSDRYLASILKHGLRPRGRRKKSNWGSYPSRPDCVYLTEAYAPYFAEQATNVKKGERSLIVEVEVDEQDPRLLPDEDFIAQAMASQLKVSIEAVHLGVRNALEGYAHHALDSLRGLGNVCIKGLVSPEAISRYVVVDFSKQTELWQVCLDPSISLLNYRFCGEKYKSVIKWLFGDSEDYSVGFSGLPNADFVRMMERSQPGYGDRIKGMFVNREGIEVHDHGCIEAN